MIGADDYDVWKPQFGQTLPTTSDSNGESVASAALVAPSDESTVSPTSLSTSAGEPPQTAELQRSSDGKQATSPREYPLPVLAPHSPVTSYRASPRTAVDAQHALVANQRAAALLAWLAEQPDSKHRFEHCGDLECWAIKSAREVEVLDMGTLEQVVAHLASS